MNYIIDYKGFVVLLLIYSFICLFFLEAAEQAEEAQEEAVSLLHIIHKLFYFSNRYSLHTDKGYLCHKEKMQWKVLYKKSQKWHIVHHIWHRANSELSVTSHTISVKGM